MTTLIAAFGVVIAGFGALIAYFQWRTTHQRVVLDLFERRVAVFQEIENAAKAMLNAVTRKEIDSAFWSFVRAEANARFLFGAEVAIHLADRRADCAAIAAFSDVSEDHPEWRQMKERQYEALKHLADFVQNSASLFSPYIRLDQKMPGLWWPVGKRVS